MIIKLEKCNPEEKKKIFKEIRKNIVYSDYNDGFHDSSDENNEETHHVEE